VVGGGVCRPIPPVELSSQTAVGALFRVCIEGHVERYGEILRPPNPLASCPVQSSSVQFLVFHHVEPLVKVAFYSPVLASNLVGPLQRVRTAEEKVGRFCRSTIEDQRKISGCEAGRG
jgi:hypothetical protein